MHEPVAALDLDKHNVSQCTVKGRAGGIIQCIVLSPISSPCVASLLKSILDP